MKTTLVQRLLNRYLLVATVLVLSTHCGLAQRVEGELNVIVDGGLTRRIDVTAQTTVHGTKAAWYPQVDSMQSAGGQVVAQLNCHHIDRAGTPTQNIIGYAVYKVAIGDYYIYVDWRDADYTYQPPYVNNDVWIHFDASRNQFYRIPESGSNVWFTNGATTNL